jgi:hypothetical protein
MVCDKRRMFRAPLVHVTVALAFLAAAPPGSAQAVAPPKAALEIVNRSSGIILNLQISGLTDPTWSADFLATGFIDLAGSFTIRDLEPGLYDVRLIRQSGHPCTIENVPVEGTVRLEVDDVRLSACFEDALMPRRR